MTGSLSRPTPAAAAARRSLLALLSVGLLACDRGAPASGRGDAAAVTLGAPDSLPSPAGAGSGEPNLAVAPDGRVYLSWLEPMADSGHALRFATLEGDGWSTPRTIASGTNFFVNWADFPSVLPLADGALAAHWLQRNGPGRVAYDVRLARSTDGGATWTPSVVPHRDGTENEHGFVSLWAAGGDSVGAVWLDGRKYGAGGSHGPSDGHGGGEMTLMTGTLAADGTAGAERLLDDRTCDCCQTTVAVTSRGPIVLYRDRSPTETRGEAPVEIRDIAVVRHVDGAWTQPAIVHPDGWEIAACPVNGPAAAADGERVVAAWFTGARDSARVHVSFSADAGATWSPPVRVDGGQPAGRTGAVLLEDGSALVSWLERTGGEGAAVRVRRVSPDGAPGEPVTITESSAARSSGFPRMVRSGSAVYLAWTQPGTPSQVRVARLSLAAGAP